MLNSLESKKRDSEKPKESGISNVSKKSIHILNRKQFDKESAKKGIVYALVATRVEPLSESSHVPLEVHQVLSNFNVVILDDSAVESMPSVSG